MQFWKRTRIFIDIVLITTLVMQPLMLRAHATCFQESSFQKKFTASDAFKSFIDLMVIKAYKTNTTHELSEALLRCYERIVQGKSTLFIEDVIVAYPELHAEVTQVVNTLPEQTRVWLGYLPPVLTECDFNDATRIITQLNDVIEQCCEILQEDFEITWTLLADLKNSLTTSSIISFTDVTVLIDTLTECCAQAENNFENTWTILEDISTTLSVDFDGTFTALEDVLVNVTATVTVIVDINPIFTILTDIQETITTDFNGTFTLIEDIKNTLTECCASAAEGFEGTFTVIAEIKETLTTDFDGTFTVIEEIIVSQSSTFTVIQEIVNTLTIGFNGTFTSIADIKNTLTACCQALQQDFEDTWTILADIKHTITTDFNGTFTALEAITGSIDVLVDLTGVYTIAAAGFNGTYTVIADLKETVTASFDATFTAIQAFSACFAMSLTAPTNITGSGYYCLANDVTGSFTISADNVVLDLNNHTVSTGGIFVSSGSNRIIKNGRLNNSASGIVLTANANTQLAQLLITNATAPSIAFNGTCSDNSIQDVVIENGTGGISGTNDTNLHINNVTINDMTSFGMSFTLSNNLTMNHVSILSTDADGIDLNNPTNANLNDVTLNTVANAGIRSFGTTERCTFDTIIVCNSPNILFGINLAIPNNCSLTNCLVMGLGSTTFPDTITGILLGTGGTNNIVQSCYVKNISARGLDHVNGFLIQASNSSIKDCIGQAIVGGMEVNAFFSSGNSNIFSECYANTITYSSLSSTPHCRGFFLVGNDTEVFDSQAARIIPFNLVTTTTTFYSPMGFVGTGQNLGIYNCVAANITKTGSGAGGAGVGFLTVDGSNAIVKDCTATFCSGDSYNISSNNSMIIDCIAWQGRDNAGTLNPLFSDRFGGTHTNAYIHNTAVQGSSGFSLPTSNYGFHNFTANITGVAYSATMSPVQLASASPPQAGSSVEF